MTEWLHFHLSLSCIGEGQGNPLHVLAWRIPGTGEPGGLPSMGSHRVGHDWSDLAAAAAHASKVMLKILQARLQQYVNRELPDVQAGFRKEQEIKLPTSDGSSKKQESSRKTSISALLMIHRMLAIWSLVPLPFCYYVSILMKMMKKTTTYLIVSMPQVSVQS